MGKKKTVPNIFSLGGKTPFARISVLHRLVSDTSFIGKKLVFSVASFSELKGVTVISASLGIVSSRSTLIVWG